MTEFNSVRTEVAPKQRAERAAPAPYWDVRDFDRPDLRQALSVVRRRVWHVLACGFFIGLAFFTYTARLAPSYTAEAIVLLDPRDYRLLPGQQELVPHLSLSSATIESELALLRSAGLMAQVVERLGEDQLAAFAPQPTRRVLLSLLADTSNAATEDRDLEIRTRHLAWALMERTQVRRIDQSYAIGVAVTTGQPELSASIANALSAAYLSRQLSDRKAVATAARQALHTQIDATRTALIRAESQVALLRQVQLERAGATEAILDQQLLELNSALAQTASEITAAKAEIATLTVQRGTGADAALLIPPDLGTEALYRLLERRGDIEENVARLSVTFGVKHPERQRLADDVVRLKTRIEEELETILAARQSGLRTLQQQEDALRADVVQREAQLLDLASASRDLRRAEVEAEVTRESYQRLVNRQSEIAVEAEMQTADARIINMATPPVGPSAPRPKLMGFFGASLGLSIGLASVLVLEAFGSGFASRAALERATGLPVLAEVPDLVFDDNADLAAQMARPSGSALTQNIAGLLMQLEIEAFEGTRAVAIVGNPAAEGLSSLTAALAQYSAQRGRRSILVDMTHSPAATLLPDGRGTRDAANIDITDQIETPSDLEFDVLNLSQDVSRISPEDMTSILQQLKTRYDLVILQAGPCDTACGSLRAAFGADQLLYVVGKHATARADVLQALQLMQRFATRPDGLVFFGAEDLRAMV
ncbi:GumC family protein [Cognatishimia maritima]|uniref:Uncharacterized protein involved in exopolysaccharide biosynthesis n=1 Tax=Cognatishimia maritima TaxID=870908 RepID=A0A1M5N9Q6_9RHOB|nr:GNVR domain-containing protein [Cognatishimia maritima]SHG85743.1 Uncharacterized protein involved in exopolysaccharide biosynthesis [Cognatishimia maritima]